MPYWWQQIPIIRAVIPYVLGILTVIFSGFEAFLPFWPTVISATVLALVAHWITSKKYALRWLVGIPLTLVFFAIGYQNTINQRTIQDEDHFQYHAGEEDLLAARILKPTETKPNSIKAVVNIQAIYDSNKSFLSKGKSWVYFSKDSNALNLNYGDVVLLKNNLSLIEPPKNPDQFNLKKFLAYHNIYHQAYFESEDWERTGIQEQNAFYATIYNIRNKVLSWLKAHIDREKEFGVAAALLVGYKAAINDKLRQSYASTGAMHVLAVSGLHVGILYLLLSRFLSSFGKLGLPEWGQAIVIIGFLWFYAFLTGLSPSVFRAATMFTFVTIGQNMKRITNIYGSIITSLFVLLLINPFLITQVGFQLSYAAVIGIVFLQPKIYSLIPEPRFWLPRQLWSLTAVSLAAQIATFPLGIFYFNQFPTYFFISNLMVIPAAATILYTGIAFILIQALGLLMIGNLLGQLLNLILWCLNQMIFRVENLPNSLIEGLYLTTPQLALLYGFIFTLVFSLAFRQKRLLFAGLICFISLWSLIAIEKVKDYQTPQLTFHHVSGSSLVSFVHGSSGFYLGDQKILKNQEQLKFNSYRYFWEQGINPKEAPKYAWDSITKAHVVDDIIKIDKPFIIFKDQKILWVDENFHLPKAKHLNQKFNIDYLILSHGPEFKPKKLKKVCDFETLIIDGSLKPWEQTEWVQACKSWNNKCWPTDEKGAFQITKQNKIKTFNYAGAF